MLLPIEVGGVPVIPFKNIEQVLQSIFDENQQIIPGVAIAINPEKIMKGIESPEVKKILLGATIPYADGIGVVKVMEKKANEKLSRIPGVQLWNAVVKHTAKTNNSVYLIGSRPEVLDSCVDKIVEQTNVTIAGAENGYFTDEKGLIEQVKLSGAKVVIVALGSPKQEVFINKCRELYPEAFYMGVGGSFDVYVGKIKRAPDFWINLNLEWFYRLISEPKRIFRQYKLLKFFYLSLLNKL